MKPSKVKIIIVDDEHSVRRSLVEFLADYDFTICSATNAEDAIEILKEETCDVGVIDLRLPGMSGEMLIQQAHKIIPDMKFIIHTGSVGYSLPEELIQIGMQPEHVFLKPLPDLMVIINAINTLYKKNE